MVVISSIQDGTKTTRIVGPGCIIGEDAILKVPYSYSAECLDRISVDEYRVSDLNDNDILAGLAMMHHDAWRDRQAAQEGNLKVRLIRALVDLSSGTEELDDGWFSLNSMPTHHFLSEMIGASRSTVTAYMNEWTKNKQGIRESSNQSGVVEINPKQLDNLKAQLKSRSPRADGRIR